MSTSLPLNQGSVENNKSDKYPEAIATNTWRFHGLHALSVTRSNKTFLNLTGKPFDVSDATTRIA